MNQQEFERQQRVCQEQSRRAVGVAIGGQTLGYMNPLKGANKAFAVNWCGEEEQAKFVVGSCHQNSFHLNNKIKGQVWNGYRTLPNGNKDTAPHYWVFKNQVIWDINTFPMKNNEGEQVRIWGYVLYNPKDFFERYKIKTIKRIR